MSTRSGSCAGSAAGSDRLSELRNVVFHPRFDSALDHCGTADVGSRGCGREERRGVLS